MFLETDVVVATLMPGPIKKSTYACQGLPQLQNRLYSKGNPLKDNMGIIDQGSILQKT